MGDQNQGDVECPTQLVDLVLETSPHRAVDRREGLIEQQHRRLTRQGSRERHPLPFAARQLVGPPVDRSVQVYEIQQRVRAVAAFMRGRWPSAVITLPAAVRCGKSAYS